MNQKKKVWIRKPQSDRYKALCFVPKEHLRKNDSLLSYWKKESTETIILTVTVDFLKTGIFLGSLECVYLGIYRYILTPPNVVRVEFTMNKI